MVTDQFDSMTVLVTDLLEHIFVAIFVIELVLKIKVCGGASYYPSNPAARANFIDMLLVIASRASFLRGCCHCAPLFLASTARRGRSRP